jgi:hypothetical protein
MISPPPRQQKERNKKGSEKSSNPVIHAGKS